MVECHVNTCNGDLHIFIDGSGYCNACGAWIIQWTKPLPDEPIENAKEFKDYEDDVVEYIHGDFSDWYNDYIKLIDIYYNRTRGWPNKEAKRKFTDLLMIAPIKFFQLQRDRMKEDVKRIVQQSVKQQLKQQQVQRRNRKNI